MAPSHPPWVYLAVLLGVAICTSNATGDIFYFSSWPRGGRVGAGEGRVLSCAVSDTTSISLSWHLDGRPITYSSRRHLRGGSREDIAWDLVIERAVPEDAGEYTCIAHNTTSGFALTSLPATITVLWVAETSRVVLADHRELDSVKTGSSVTLRCRVDGGPDLYYSWKRNGDSVAGLTSVTVARRRLTIDSYDAVSHNGVYTCSATIYKPGTPQHNDVVRQGHLTATTTSVPLVLAVKDPRLPSIVEVPESQVVGPDQPAMLKCSYEDETLTEWYLQDSGPLTNDSRHTVLGNGSLMILAANIGDEGVYKCVGVHSERSDSSSYAARLTLAYLDDKNPPMLEPGPNIGSSHVVGLGGRLRVICLPPAGLPRPDVTWVSPQLQKLQPSGSIQVDGAALEVEDATDDHAGNYTCVVSNIAGNSSVSLDLVITRKPEVQMMTSSVSVLEEETGRLECRMDTSPSPYTNVSWTRNGQLVSVDDYRITLSGMGEGVSQSQGVSVLRIRWARLTDAGLYVCIVTTEGHAPVHTLPAKLDVIERLKFSPRPVDSRVEVGGNVSIPCEARGAVTPEVNWFRPNASKLIEATADENIQVTDGTLEVIGAELHNSGAYVCFATSEQGSINTTINLAVIESPVMEWVTNSPVQVDKGGTLILECRARGSPKPSIHWDYNHTPNAFDPDRVEMHGNGTLQLSGVRQEDGGVYGCTAGNMGGLVRAEITVTVTGESTQLLGRTVGVAVGGAAAYIALVGAMLIYCRQRRLRLKHSPPHIRGDGSEEAQSPEEQERLMYTARPSAPLDADIREFGTATSKAAPQPDPTCQVQLSQVSTHTLGTSTHLGLSQASTKTIGGSSVSTQHSSPLQPNSPPSAQSTNHAGPSDSMYPKHESNHVGQDKSKIQRENIHVLLTLGRGEFGEVQLARLRSSSEETDGEDTPPDPDKLVMVKVINTRDEQLLAEVCREAAMFSGPPHPHVVTNLGLCTSHTPHLLVTQYTDWGDLKQFLLATRKESPRPLGSLRPPPLTYQQCLSLSLQVAEALEYLSGRRHTHKDIAARNCLITSTLQLKLAAPALTRDAYAAEYCTYRNQVLPVRWLAPEALLEDEYSMKSSVFSWAWLAWEVLTQAALPHSTLTDQQVMAAAQTGDLQCTVPQGTPADLTNLLTGCWQHSPKARPSIQSVVETLKTLS